MRKRYWESQQQQFSASSTTTLALDRAKITIEQFLYSCSHTFRSPIKSLAGLINLAKNSSDQDLGLLFEAMEKTVLRMDTTLDDLELFLINSRDRINVKPILFLPFLEDVINEFSQQIIENKILVTATVRQNTPFYTDEARLRIIISNLIRNAITFRKQHASNCLISVSMVLDKSFCVIDIHDNGIGIPSDVLPDIFKLFFRGSSQSTGAGIGLFVVKDTLQKINGEISIDSCEGNGCTFSMRIPVYQ